jgi:L-amino acid N-acyltransferase YncA
MLVRAATTDDWSAIWPFYSQIVKAAETYAIDADITFGEGRAQWMQPPPGQTFVAVDDNGSVIGSASVYRNRPAGGSHVASASFMVDPRSGRRGVGRALAEHVLSWARSQGFKAMQFNAVVETNTRAVRLWETLGFEILATVPQAFDHPADGLVGLHVMHRFL